MTKSAKVTFIPAETFTGYPFGHRTLFQKDQRSIPVAKSYAELMRSKGHVKQGTAFTPVEEEKDEK